LDIPIYIQNPCPVGGLTFVVYCTDPSWLYFTTGVDTANWDTLGSCLSGWESLGGIVQSISPGTIRITGLADMPGGDDDVHLPPGPECLLVTLHPIFNNYDVCDTSQLILISNASVSDTTGYNLYDVILSPDSLYVLEGNCSNNPRGDANCGGTLNGLDVIYLVGFLKGNGPSYCCLCSGDVNNSGGVNGVDVTYLVSYLKGQAPAPVPCD
jgi:hypothetical protein